MIVLSRAAIRSPQSHNVVTSRFNTSQRRGHCATGVSCIVNQYQAARTNDLGSNLKLRPNVFGFVQRIQQHRFINFTSIQRHLHARNRIDRPRLNASLITLRQHGPELFAARMKKRIERDHAPALAMRNGRSKTRRRDAARSSRFEHAHAAIRANQIMQRREQRQC